MTRSLLALFADPESASKAITALQAHGTAQKDVEVLTDSPYPEGAFGEPPARHRLYVFPLVGAACGFVVGLLLTIGVQIAYPEVQGGKPLLSIPPMINVLYEATLLGAIVLTVIGVIFESRLPDVGGEPYDVRVSEGFIGVLVQHPSDSVDQLLRGCGAVDVMRVG